MVLNKQDLAKIEIDCVSKGYSHESLSHLQESYRKSRELFQNLKPIHIIIPVADRNDFLNNLISSIQGEIRAFGFPHSLISVSVVNDSKNPIHNHDIGSPEFDVKIRNIPEQIDFIKSHYPADKLSKIYGSLLKPLPEGNNDWSKKGSGSTMNTARLLVNKTVDTEKSILRFIDSDEEFSILTLDEKGFRVVPHAFSMFDAIQDIFKDFDPDIVTGKITGDPAFSAPQMLRTQLTDILKQTDRRLPVEEYFHENRAYNDLPLFSQEKLSKAYVDGFPILSFQDRGEVKKHPYHSILMGHHISRPICYSNPEKILSTGAIDRKVYIGDIIRPGNVAGNRKLLEYPTPFVESKVRLHGPILGKLLSKMGQKIHTANVPLLHRRVFDVSEITKGFRGGTFETLEGIDISELWIKQMSGDVVMQYVSKCNSYDALKEGIFDECYLKVMSAYEKQIKDISSLLNEIGAEIDNEEVLYLSNSLRLSLEKLKFEKESIRKSLLESLTYLQTFESDIQNWQSLLAD